MKHTSLALVLLLGLPLGAACGPKSTPVPAGPSPEPSAAEVEETPGGGGERTPATSFELDGSKLVLPGPIVFTTDALDVESSQAALWYIHDYLVAKEYVTLMRIEGHGDQPGNDATMFTGAQALAVGEWLVKSGIDCKRLLAVAFGNTKPIADMRTPEGRAQNRRIELINAELRGKAIDGMPVDGGGLAARVCD